MFVGKASGGDSVTTAMILVTIRLYVYDYASDSIIKQYSVLTLLHKSISTDFCNILQGVHR